MPVCRFVCFLTDESRNRATKQGKTGTSEQRQQPNQQQAGYVSNKTTRKEENKEARKEENDGRMRNVMSSANFKNVRNSHAAQTPRRTKQRLSGRRPEEGPDKRTGRERMDGQAMQSFYELQTSIIAHSLLVIVLNLSLVAIFVGLTSRENTTNHVLYIG